MKKMKIICSQNYNNLSTYTDSVSLDHNQDLNSTSVEENKVPYIRPILDDVNNKKYYIDQWSNWELIKGLWESVNNNNYGLLRLFKNQLQNKGVGKNNLTGFIRAIEDKNIRVIRHKLKLFGFTEENINNYFKDLLEFSTNKDISDKSVEDIFKQYSNYDLIRGLWRASLNFNFKEQDRYFHELDKRGFARTSTRTFAKAIQMGDKKTVDLRLRQFGFFKRNIPDIFGVGKEIGRKDRVIDVVDKEMIVPLKNDIKKILEYMNSKKKELTHGPTVEWGGDSMFHELGRRLDRALRALSDPYRTVERYGHDSYIKDLFHLRISIRKFLEYAIREDKDYPFKEITLRDLVNSLRSLLNKYKIF
jgi:hypothetical protein